MKKLFTVFALLLTLISKGQVYQKYPQFGGEWNRLWAKNIFTIPNDTLTPPVNGGDDMKDYPALASKGDVLYYWSVAEQKYISIGSLSTALTSIYAGYGLINVNDSTLRIDSATTFSALLNTVKVTSTGTLPPAYVAATRTVNIPRDQRVGIYLNPNKTWTRFAPYVWGNTWRITGNSWSALSGGLAGGTAYPEQIRIRYDVNISNPWVAGSEFASLIQANWSAMGDSYKDIPTFVEMTMIPIANSAATGLPYLGTYQFGETTRNDAKTYRYINAGYRSFIANYYLKDNWNIFSLAPHTGFRNEEPVDSLGSKYYLSMRGIGTISVSKPAGETSFVLGTMGADGVRKTAGIITLKVGSDTLFSKSFNATNNCNRGLAPQIGVGWNYDAIVLQNLPDTAQTIDIVVSGDSTWVMYYGHLQPAGDHNRRLFISNIAYGAGGTSFTWDSRVIDTANLMLQDAVMEFYNYPVFINNNNGLIDSTSHVKPDFHPTSAGSDAIANNYFQNLIPIYKAPVTGGVYTASRALVSSAAGTVTPSSTTATQIGYVSDVTGLIQAQIDTKLTKLTVYTTQTGTSYTLQASDNGTIIRFTNGSDVTLTVPAGLPAGFNCGILQIGAGEVIFTASSTTINNADSFTKTKQYAYSFIGMQTTDSFITQGNMQ